jgi:hypothetical protein
VCDVAIDRRTGNRTRPDKRKDERKIAARSQAQLAECHGVTQQAVGKWVRDPRWREAGFSVRGPWTIPEVARQKLWRQEHFQEDRAAEAAGVVGMAGAAGGGPTDMQKAKLAMQIKLAMAKEEQIRLEMAIKRAEYIKRSEAEEKQAVKFRAVRNALMQLPAALRAVLADAVDAGSCERILEDALRRVCTEGFGA